MTLIQGIHQNPNFSNHSYGVEVTNPRTVALKGFGHFESPLAMRFVECVLLFVRRTQEDEPTACAPCGIRFLRSREEASKGLIRVDVFGVVEEKRMIRVNGLFFTIGGFLVIASELHVNLDIARPKDAGSLQGVDGLGEVVELSKKRGMVEQKLEDEVFRSIEVGNSAQHAFITFRLSLEVHTVHMNCVQRFKGLEEEWGKI